MESIAPERPLGSGDRVRLVNEDGTVTDDVVATYQNVVPKSGEVTASDKHDIEQVLVVIAVEGSVYRVQETSFRQVSTDGSKIWLRGSEVHAFARTFDAGKRHAGDLGRIRKQRVAGGDSLVGTLTAMRSGTTTSESGEKAKLNFAWNNCGRTAVNLAQALQDLKCLQLVKEYQTREIRPAALPSLISVVDGLLGGGKSYLVDITFSGIHTFTLEIHPDGCHLIQGYQAGYSAFWWQGLTDHPLALPGTEPSQSQLPSGWETFQAATSKARDTYGRNALLKSGQVTGLLNAIHAMFGLGKDGLWTEAAYRAFLELPFYPGQSALDLTGETEGAKAKREQMGTLAESRPATAQEMALFVTISEITDPGRLRTELGSASEHSVCHLVLLRVTRKLVG